MDIKTQALVLRRTNYGEADRILNLLTPEGKKSVIAKGVRREKSKLAGGIELFSISSVTIHQSQKSNLGILTSTRLQNFYSHILEDYTALEFAYEILKSVNKRAENADSPEFFFITQQALTALNSAGATPLVVAWWWLNLARISGDSINFHTDTFGQKLSPNQTYEWDVSEATLRPSPLGPISAPHIKLLRLLLTSPLSTALKVTNSAPLLPDLLPIAKCFS